MDWSAASGSRLPETMAITLITDAVVSTQSVVDPMTTGSDAHHEITEVLQGVKKVGGFHGPPNGLPFSGLGAAKPALRF